MHEDINGSPSPDSDEPTVEIAPDLLDKLVEGSIGPLSRVRETIDMTLDQVANWIAEPANRRRIARLVALFDAQTQLMVCQHRMIAMAKLIEVLDTATSHEVVRRACRDLLNLRLVDPYFEDLNREGAGPQGCPPVIRRIALRELARLESEERS